MSAVPPSRSQRTPLSRSLVVDTAVQMLDAADDISIRDLAARLGVSAMALYRHVDSKEDLLESVVNTQLARHWRPDASGEDWQEWTIEAADRLRQFLVARPAALAVYLRRPVTSPTAMQRMAACLEVLRTGLHDDGRARSAFAAVHSYTIGFAALENARESAGVLDESGGPHSVADAQSPDARLASQLADIASPDQFRAGLRYLLAGMLADPSAD